MAMKYLGSPIDIHTGGIEHIPVHHTNEIAQSECATGTPFAKYWMHNNHLLDPTGKMSKSNDEFLTLSTLVEKGYAPAAYRYFLMSASYRKELLFSFEALDGARNAYDKLISFCQEHATTLGYVHDGYREQFKAAMYDDLNTSKALGVLWTLLRDASVSDADKYATLLHFDTVFGFGLDKIRNESVPLSKEMQALLSAREDARKKRDFEEADRLRDEMSKLGFIVKDTPDGQQVSS
jgi:cysteinyl-tRNA synthetase